MEEFPRSFSLDCLGIARTLDCIADSHKVAARGVWNYDGRSSAAHTARMGNRPMRGAWFVWGLNCQRTASCFAATSCRWCVVSGQLRSSKEPRGARPYYTGVQYKNQRFFGHPEIFVYRRGAETRSRRINRDRQDEQGVCEGRFTTTTQRHEGSITVRGASGVQSQEQCGVRDWPRMDANERGSADGLITTEQRHDGKVRSPGTSFDRGRPIEAGLRGGQQARMLAEFVNRASSGERDQQATD